MVGIVLAGLVSLQGCVAGGYAFSDTYRGTFYSDDQPSTAREEGDGSAGRILRYSHHHRSAGYVYGDTAVRR